MPKRNVQSDQQGCAWRREVWDSLVDAIQSNEMIADDAHKEKAKYDKAVALLQRVFPDLTPYPKKRKKLAEGMSQIVYDCYEHLVVRDSVSRYGQYNKSRWQYHDHKDGYVTHSELKDAFKTVYSGHVPPDMEEVFKAKSQSGQVRLLRHMYEHQAQYNASMNSSEGMGTA